jgi:hypothetical protein
VYHGVAGDEAQAASAGWGGDRAVVASGDEKPSVPAERHGVHPAPVAAQDIEDGVLTPVAGDLAVVQGPRGR